MTAVKRQHRIRWYVYAGGYGQPLVKMRHTANMRGSWPGWDAECSCGWESKTGGATRTSVRWDVWLHKVEHGEAS
jgi:hypothetical protein